MTRGQWTVKLLRQVFPNLSTDLADLYRAHGAALVEQAGVLTLQRAQQDGWNEWVLYGPGNAYYRRHLYLAHEREGRPAKPVITLFRDAGLGPKAAVKAAARVAFVTLFRGDADLQERAEATDKRIRQEHDVLVHWREVIDAVRRVRHEVQRQNRGDPITAAAVLRQIERPAYPAPGPKLPVWAGPRLPLEDVAIIKRYKLHVLSDTQLSRARSDLHLVKLRAKN